MPVSLVPVTSIDPIWPYLREGFEAACLKTGGDVSSGDLWVACRSGSAFLIVASGEAIQGASVWKQETWATGRRLRCVMLYGANMDGWIEDMRDMAMKIARDCGATSLVAEGRPGWERIFKNARKLRVIYEELI